MLNYKHKHKPKYYRIYAYYNLIISFVQTIQIVQEKDTKMFASNKNYIYIC